MEFFDRKEEVINLELTPYGKRLMSQGRFRPVYYAFYDNDIIYDTQYAGNEETQKDIEDRIKSTPRPKAQSILDGIESKFTEINRVFIDDIENKLNNLAKPGSKQNIYGLPLPIGNSALGVQNAPAWDIRFIEASASSSTDAISGSYGFIKIPQIEVDVYYNTSVSEVDAAMTSPTLNYPGPITPGSHDVEPAITEDGEEDPSVTYSGETEIDTVSVSKVYPDGTFIELDKDYVLLDIREINGLFDKENFDIEVYEIVAGSDNDESLRRLRFLKDEIEVDNDNVIYDPILKENVKVDETYVEYFFDIRIDDEIEKPLLSETQKQIISLPKSDPDSEDEPCLDEPV